MACFCLMQIGHISKNGWRTGGISNALKSSAFSWNVTENINCKSCEVACFCLMQIGHISKNDSVS